MDGRKWLFPHLHLQSPYAMGESWCRAWCGSGLETASQVCRLGPHTKLLIVNDFRTVRVAEVLSDFQSIQYFIAAAPVDPPNMNDYYTEGWAALRQCNLDGQRILNCGADTSVPETSGGPDEQAKAELKQSVTTCDAPLWGDKRLTTELLYVEQSSP